MSDPTELGGGPPPDLFAAKVTGNPDTFARLMRAFELDMGCRPHVEANRDGNGTMLIYATEARIREIRAAGFAIEPGENVSALGRERQAEVGKGDRFEGGRVTPHGLGKKSGGREEGRPAS